jgi:hypothetical protein
VGVGWRVGDCHGLRGRGNGVTHPAHAVPAAPFPPSPSHTPQLLYTVLDETGVERTLKASDLHVVGEGVGAAAGAPSTAQRRAEQHGDTGAAPASGAVLAHETAKNPPHRK